MVETEMTLWYQNAVINGEVMPAQRRRDTSQKRWNELIAPLLPSDGKGRLFLELGCNAGYYLRRASEYGYSTWGIEKEQVYYEQAKYWEAQEPCGVKIEFADINECHIPACYVCVLANVHYWLTPEQLDILIEKLSGHALHVLIVSHIYPHEAHLSDSTEIHMMKLFEKWKLLDRRNNDKHYSLIFRNLNLCEYDTQNLFNIQIFNHSTHFLSAFREFIDIVISRRRFRLDRTAYYDYAVWRGWRNKNYNLRRLRSVILKAERDGVIEPPLVRRNGLIINGNHRLVLAERLGLLRVICKIQSST